MQKRLLSLCLVLCLLLCACGQSAAPAVQTGSSPMPAGKAAPISSAKAPVQRKTSTPVDVPGNSQEALPDETSSQRTAEMPPREIVPTDKTPEPETTSESVNLSNFLQEILRNTSQQKKNTPSEPSESAKCTISIVCSTAIGKSAVVPAGGQFLPATTVALSGGETVYDILHTVCLENNIPLGGNSGYVRSIGGLAERDCGGGSGWLYRVNGECPGISCGSYKIFDGDVIEWIYTCEMGNDL